MNFQENDFDFLIVIIATKCYNVLCRKCYRRRCHVTNQCYRILEMHGKSTNRPQRLQGNMMDDITKKRAKIENAIEHIVCDYKAIIDYALTCINNKLSYQTYMCILPFFSMYVLEGYEYLCENGILNKESIHQQELEKLEKCRAVGVKLHSNFKKTTFNSLNDFNRNEYIKFFNKAHPIARLVLKESIKNYCVCFVDNFPVGNYHLYSKKILDTEIGTYIEDVSKQVYEYTFLLSRFSTEVVSGIDTSFDLNIMGQRKISIQFNSIDYNMAYDYKDFRIKQSPPILMALLDVLCVLNAYRKIFVKINKDRILDIKIKYTILFYAILSLKSIFNFCDSENIYIQAEREFTNYIHDLENRYVKNKLRKFCMHYDFPIDEWKQDPFTEEFEKEFQKPIQQISQTLFDVIDTLANKLQELIMEKT